MLHMLTTSFFYKRAAAALLNFHELSLTLFAYRVSYNSAFFMVNISLQHTS